MLYEKVPVSVKPEKDGMYICILHIVEDGFDFWPTSYVQWDSIRQEWLNPSICYISGSVTEWLRPYTPSPDVEEAARGVIEEIDEALERYKPTWNVTAALERAKDYISKSVAHSHAEREE